MGISLYLEHLLGFRARKLFMHIFGSFIRKMTTTAEAHALKTEILPVSKSAISFDSSDNLTINDETTKLNLARAAKLLSGSDQVVAFPTETVYGLGGSSFNDESIKNIYKAKNRPADNPLITHISSTSQIKSFFNLEVPDIYKPLIDKFWPGPLTILLPINATNNNKLSKLTTANQPTFAVRLPSHPIARALIHLSQVPIAAPSANASTRPSPTLAQHVYHDLQGKIPLILDGGASNVGVESTVVDGLSNPPMLLRPGGVSLEEIKQVGGKQWENVQVAKRVADPNEPVKTPGMKYKHYSPTAKVILVENESSIEKFIKENSLQDQKLALLTAQTFKGDEFKGIVENLGKTKEEISANLFSFLRKIDELGVDLIFVESVDEKDEGLAIMNRLKKAASETI